MQLRRKRFSSWSFVRVRLETAVASHDRTRCRARRNATECDRLGFATGASGSSDVRISSIECVIARDSRAPQYAPVGNAYKGTSAYGSAGAGAYSVRNPNLLCAIRRCGMAMLWNWIRHAGGQANFYCELAEKVEDLFSGISESTPPSNSRELQIDPAAPPRAGRSRERWSELRRVVSNAK